MFWDVSMLKGYAISASDGFTGTVVDLLFDDRIWKVRWLVANTRYWFPNHEVLVPVEAFGHPDPAQRRFSVWMTIQQIEDCPTVDTHPPVSQQAGVGLRRYCDRDSPNALGRLSKTDDPHLRSVEAVVGHRVQIIGGEIGHVDDLLVDDVDWTVRFVKIDTWNLRPGNRMLVPPGTIREIDWPGRMIRLDVDRREMECEQLGRSSDAAGESRDGAQITQCRIKWIRA